MLLALKFTDFFTLLKLQLIPVTLLFFIKELANLEYYLKSASNFLLQAQTEVSVGNAQFSMLTVIPITFSI